MAMNNSRTMPHSVQSATAADLLERILDKGIVITGDIKVKLVEVELLSLEIRLVICSVDKAVELGLDWWKRNPAFTALPQQGEQERVEMAERVARLETMLLQKGIEKGELSVEKEEQSGLSV